MVPEDNAHHHLPEQHHPVLVWFLMFLYTSTMGCIWVMDGGVSQGFAPWHRDWIRRCVWHLSAAGVFLSPQQAWLRCGAGGFAQPIPEAISNQIKTEETSDKITSNMKLYRLVEI